MDKILVAWDPRKESSNRRKHGVSFAEAQTVFYDECALLLDDCEHGHLEERFILLGLSMQLHLLVVCHCYRERGGVIRIISARKANRHECQQYEERKP
ncbi:MAG TPA: BrnT family toxin [bacterium]|nr:BrnT family toxin [bacterium]